MVRGKIGALVIGQAPRHDLTALLSPAARDYEIVCRGALDGLGARDLPPPAEYPLVTRLRGGEVVAVEESFLVPLLQRELDALEAAGAAATILLCAGEFAGLAPRRPLVRPFQLGARVLASMGHESLGVVVPTAAQAGAARRKWERAGFAPAVWPLDVRPGAAPLSEWLSAQARRVPELPAIVVDYVGYPAGIYRALQGAVRVPVVDLGRLAAAALEALLCIPAGNDK